MKRFFLENEKPSSKEVVGFLWRMLGSCVHKLPRSCRVSLPDLPELHLSIPELFLCVQELQLQQKCSTVAEMVYAKAHYFKDVCCSQTLLALRYLYLFSLGECLTCMLWTSMLAAEQEVRLVITDQGIWIWARIWISVMHRINAMK